MTRKPNAKQTKTPKRVLRLPDLDHSKRTVLDSLGYPDSARAYAFAMNDFISWYCSEPRLSFSKAVVVRYRMHWSTAVSLRVRSTFVSERCAALRTRRQTVAC